MSIEWDNIARPVPCEQLSAGWVCPACGMIREKDNGPDPCIGELPGVSFACCGHGGVKGTTALGQGYIAFKNGIIVRFDGVNTSVERKERQMITTEETILISALHILKEAHTDPNHRAILLQSYIAENGPLGSEAGIKVRELLKDEP